MRDDSAEIIIHFFLQCEQFWHGQECPLFDVVQPTFPLLTTASCTLQGAPVTLPPVYREARSLRSLDKSAFCKDSRTLLPPSDCSADQLLLAVRAVLNEHAPECRRRVRRAGSSPWYPEIRKESRDAQHSRRRAEKQWLKTGLTVHKSTPP